MKHNFKLIACWLLFFAVYLVGWYTEGVVVQISAVALIITSGVLIFAAGGKSKFVLSPPEYILGSAFVFALAVAAISGNELSTIYGVMFLLVLIAISLLTRYLSTNTLSAIFRYAYTALLLTIVLVQPKDFLFALVGSVEKSVGLVRFTPLGMHPNLSGLVYGGGALLFIQNFLITKQTINKLGSFFLAALCISIVLAASARASLMALGLTFAIAIGYLAWHGHTRTRIKLFITFIVALSFALYKHAEILNYLTVILDMESTTRGLDSGATGRTDLWKLGFALIFSDTLYFFTGRGVRSASADAIGFSVESSYINIALEHGAIYFALIIMLFVYSVYKAMRLARTKKYIDYVVLFDGMIILFILLQSIFNRYLIAVGNPYSLIALFVLLRIYIKFKLANVNQKINNNILALKGHLN